MPQLRVLGCSGGIGGARQRTTALLVDRDILLDAGTGVGDLELDELAAIDHVFVTHSHLDHISSIPFMVDTVGHVRRGRPLNVWGREGTIEALRAHVFNWSIWPDFTWIPNADEPFLRLRTIAVGEEVELDGRRITALPANHVVPAQGYAVSTDAGSLAYTGDTTRCDDLWLALDRLPKLRALIVETAFSDNERELALRSKHLCPSLLKDELAKLQSRPEILLTHLKPGESELVLHQVEELVRGFAVRPLRQGEVIEF